MCGRNLKSSHECWISRLINKVLCLRNQQDQTTLFSCFSQFSTNHVHLTVLLTTLQTMPQSFHGWFYSFFHPMSNSLSTAVPFTSNRSVNLVRPADRDVLPLWQMVSSGASVHLQVKHMGGSCCPPPPPNIWASNKQFKFQFICFYLHYNCVTAKWIWNISSGPAYKRQKIKTSKCQWHSVATKMRPQQLYTSETSRFNLLKV